jgi:hypothetical protein
MTNTKKSPVEKPVFASEECELTNLTPRERALRLKARCEAQERELPARLAEGSAALALEFETFRQTTQILSTALKRINPAELDASSLPILDELNSKICKCSREMLTFMEEQSRIAPEHYQTMSDVLASVLAEESNPERKLELEALFEKSRDGLARSKKTQRETEDRIRADLREIADSQELWNEMMRTISVNSSSENKSKR